ncbi:hypothetical protein JOF56_003036 [Kibdelosporangium banguiense]|uniref:PASTA domain-containing protein n=1 Tax=Kibdelosporangium banguiense TaxID=1365924 RepID=A0ABS4TE10_9PSEU|nr:hypothetical protein [Kibdelosporangium banguiense]MBP2322651.1 hypothetical protein [Kibdelosporangium banguiense]
MYALAGVLAAIALAAGSVILVDTSPTVPQVIANPDPKAEEEQTNPQDPNANKNPPDPQNPSGQPIVPSNGQPYAPTTSPQPAPPHGVATAAIVDFQLDADGRLLPLDELVSGTTWSKRGVVVSTEVSQATFNCRDAKGLALRISRPGLAERIPVSGAGIYLASSSLSTITTCNAVPLRLILTKPLTAANVVFTGLPNIKYTATFYFANGETQSLEAACRAIGEECKIGLEVPTDSSPIKSIVFGHSRSVTESTRSITMLKKIGFTRVP